MDTIDRIEDLIVAGSEGFFDEPDIREDLHVTIRVARHFYDFLVKFGDRPPAKEVAYVMDTIRSGLDECFALAYLCRFFDTSADTWAFGTHEHWDFPVLRERFLRGFEDLAGSLNKSAVDRLASLLALCHLELVFLAHGFPSAILGDVRDPVDDARTAAAFRSDLSEWQAGRISFNDVMARALAQRYKDRP